MRKIESILITTFLIVSLNVLGCKPKNTNINQDSNKASQSCEEILQGSPYRYLHTEDGLVYQTCKMKDGRPVVITDYKDKGYRMTHYRN